MMKIIINVNLITLIEDYWLSNFYFTWGNVSYGYGTFFQVENLIINYDWIADEKKYFGQPNTAYDFKANDPKEAERRIKKLSDTKDKLSKNVNMRAMNMLGKAEEQVL